MGIFCSFFTRSCFNPAIVHKTRATTDEYSRGERARSLFLEQALTHVYCPIFHYTVLSKIKRGRTASWRHNSLPPPLVCASLRTLLFHRSVIYTRHYFVFILVVALHFFHTFLFHRRISIFFYAYESKRAVRKYINQMWEILERWILFFFFFFY